SLYFSIPHNASYFVWFLHPSAHPTGHRQSLDSISIGSQLSMFFIDLFIYLSNQPFLFLFYTSIMVDLFLFFYSSLRFYAISYFVHVFRGQSLNKVLLLTTIYSLRLVKAGG